jgi:hypothetical protein
VSLRDRLAAGDLDALDDPALELDLLADPPATPEHWWWAYAGNVVHWIWRQLRKSTGAAHTPANPQIWHTYVLARIASCQRLRALQPQGCERELRALARLEQLCGLT